MTVECFNASGGRICNETLALIPRGEERRVVLTDSDPAFCIMLDVNGQVAASQTNSVEDSLRAMPTLVSMELPSGVWPSRGGSIGAPTQSSLSMAAGGSFERLPSGAVEAKVESIQAATPEEAARGIRFRVTLVLRSISREDGNIGVFKGGIPRSTDRRLANTTLISVFQLDRAMAMRGGRARVQLPRERSSVKLLVAGAQDSFGQVIHIGNRVMFASGMTATEIPFQDDGFTQIGRIHIGAAVTPGQGQIGQRMVAIRRPQDLTREAIIEIMDAGSPKPTLISII